MRFFFVLLLMCCSASAWAGGFTQSDGGYYAKVWVRTLIGDRAFDVAGDVVDLPEAFQDHQLNVYAEYGVTNELTAVAFLTPVGLSRYGEVSRGYGGSFTFGLRHALLTGARPLALEVRAGARPSIGAEPLGAGVLETSTFVVRSTLPTAFLDVELQAATGLPYGMWATASAGARQHTRAELSPALFGNLQLGISTSFGLSLEVHAVAFLSVERPNETDVLGVGRTDYIGVGVGLGYWVTEHFGVTIGADLAPSARANAAAVPLQIGVQLKG